MVVAAGWKSAGVMAVARERQSKDRVIGEGERTKQGTWIGFFYCFLAKNRIKPNSSSFL